MMATRNPKVAPKKPKTRTSNVSKEQAWTDTDDTETTKESGPNSETVKDSSDPENNPQKGSLISVREAEESNRDSYENEEQPAGPSQTNGVHADVPMTTDTEVLNGTDETDSQASLQSATRRRIKRNTVVPTDAEDSGRQTPESEARKDAWSVSGETDADVESNAASSRPSSAYKRVAKQKPRPATAAISRAIPTPVERPKTAPVGRQKGVQPLSETGKRSSSTRPMSAVSRPRSSQGQENVTSRPSSGTLALTNGETPEEWTDSSPPMAIEATRDRESSSSRNSGLLAPPQLAGEQNAYIPYIFARESIERVMDDMKRMKANHIKIVDRIQNEYKLIEDDVQGKFNTFVLNLRTEYAGKVATFRHVITVHREDQQKRESHWENTVKSLQAKNKTLLQEKRKLMILNRDEFTRLEQEKHTAVTDLTRMLDERHAKYVAVVKDFQGERKRAEDLEIELESLKKRLQEDTDSSNTELANLRTQHDEDVQELRQQLEHAQKVKQEMEESLEKEKAERKEKEDNLEEEKKQLSDDLEAQKAEVQRLQEEREKLQQGASAAAAVVATTTVVKSEAPETEQLKESTGEEEVREKEEAGDAVPAVAVSGAVVALDSEEKAKLTKEIARHEEEIEKINKELSRYKEEELKNKEKLASLEEEISHTSKEKARFEKQATETKQELRETRQQCAALRDQLQTLLATAAPAQSDAETEEKLKSAEAERQQLVEEQAKMKEEFDKWKEQFKEQNEGQEPTEEDRSDEVQAMMAKLKDEEEKLKKAESTIAVMTMLKEGTVPETVAPIGVSTEKLDELEDKVSKLEAERDELEVKAEVLTRERDSAQERNTEIEEKIKELESEVEELRSENEGQNNEIEELKNELENAGDRLGPLSPTLSLEGQDIEGLSGKLSELEEELEKASKELENEKAENTARVDEIESLKQELSQLKDGSSGRESELEAQLNSVKETLQGELQAKQQALDEANKRIEELENKLLANVPVDTAKEIKNYQEKIATLQKEKESLTKEKLAAAASVSTLTAKVGTLTASVNQQKATDKELQETKKKMRLEKDKELKEAKEKIESKSKKQAEESNKQIQALQKRIKELEAAGIPRADAGPKRKDSRAAAEAEKLAKDKEKLQAQVEALKKAAQEDHSRIKQLEKDVKEAASKAKSSGPSAEDRAASKKQEKQLKDLTKNLEMEKKKVDKLKDTVTKTEEELKALKKEHDALSAENKKDKNTLSKLETAAQEGVVAMEKVEELTKEVKQLRDENKTLSDNYNSERILRKKYYNMVEDMKGKIRVYCRARPLSKSEKERGNYSVIKSPDEYTLIVDTQRGPKDFQYDAVFTPDHGQEKVFEDTNNLIQSAVDGYNVCIFAYGQTGSGKTYTMIGDKDRTSPGIAPRAMEAIFSLMNENKSKFSFKVCCYMLELYNDRLIDLLAPSGKEPAKLEIKKDKKGLVFVQGSVMPDAPTKDKLWEIFERGSENRHVASTKMNAESSRSHLILGIVIESTNLTSGAVVKGKLSLVDLAGSERAAKTEASAEQLKEAMSINKSLSALGDVISALSSEQSFIPYRNNKLTMLMQDSLGGNAKTLMFVNISPADYNTDETVTSLTYASRVKLITNDAQKNADNKEIARLKGLIAKLKKGEAVDDPDDI